MTSKLKTDVLETVSGSGTIALTNQLSGMTSASMPSGTVLQIVTAEIGTTLTMTSTSLADTPFTVTITPTATNSKIIVVASGNWGSQNDGRHGLEMQSNSSGSFVTLGSTASIAAYAQWNKVYSASMQSLTAIETNVGTTNAVTYKMRGRVITAGANLFVPLTHQYASIIAYEIAG
jgi:hypothetical protein|tara:strand:+ start:136 stop:663 length:528 start_codon:yes stop_codon:yes gene_type:complete